METPIWIWIAFNAVVLLLLFGDLVLLHRKPHAVSVKDATMGTAVWVTLSLLFGAWIWHWRGPDQGLQFLTGYVVEYSLSVDNLFVFVLLFGYFAVPKSLEHRVLFWGILAALVMRGAMIGIGVALIERFAWIMYVFGAFLIYTGLKMFFHEEIKVEPEHNPIVKLCRKFFPVTSTFEGAKFFVRRNGKLMMTPLFLVFAVVNLTDLMFATDSIPAIFAITTDPFLVYTSNICAILGLRTLYFLLAGVMNLFIYLQAGIAIVLTYVGVKMVIVKFVHIPTWVSLSVIAVVLGSAVVASLIAQKKKQSKT